MNERSSKGIQAAQAKLRQMKEDGTLKKRTSVPRAGALLRYFFDLEGVYTFDGKPRKSTREQTVEESKRYGRTRYRAVVAEHKGRLIEAIEATCFECVGGDSDDGPKLRVRDCSCSICPLHQIRPWQNLKGRKATEAPEEGTLNINS